MSMHTKYSRLQYIKKNKYINTRYEVKANRFPEAATTFEHIQLP